jgi:hypothetical protein
MDGGDPVRAGEGPALRVGNRHQRHVVELAIQRRQVGMVEPAMQRGEGLVREVSEEGQVQLLDVEMQHVELARAAAHALEHHQMVGQGILDARIEAQRARRAGDEPRARLGIGAREEGHVVPEAHQLLGEIENHPFGAPIEPRGHALR